MNAKINLQSLWQQNQHLNFGEICQVVEAAERAASDIAWELTKAKIKNAGKKKSA